MQRIISVDIAKGIVILLVILGHAIAQERNGLREIIYSFHMPLFFILSAYTTRCSSNLNEVWNRSRRIVKKLAVPMLALWLIFATHSFINNINDYPSIADFIIQKLLQLLYASGVTNSQLVILGGGNIEAIGFPWFFAVLIGSKIIYDFVQVHFRRYVLFFIICLLTCFGVWIGRWYHFPFSIDISFAVLFFLWFGNQLKKSSINFNFRRFGLAFFPWITSWCIIYNYASWGLELAGRSYPLFPLCFIEGIAGTLVVIYISDLLSRKNSFLTSQFILFGRCTLTILFIHCIDFLWKDYYNVSAYQWMNVVLRIAIDVTIFYAYIMAKSIYKTRSQAKAIKTIQ